MLQREYVTTSKMSSNLKNFVLLLSLSAFIECADVQFFRKDYKYLEETESYYKIHTIRKDMEDAAKQCAYEGAKLFYPEDEFEAVTVISHLNRTHPKLKTIFIGVNSILVEGVFETEEGLSIDEIYNNWDDSEPNNKNGDECVLLHRNGFLSVNDCAKTYPYICKKTLSSIEWNDLCAIPDNKFLYNSKTGKCYRYHQEPTSWTNAYSACSAEQSYLAVINSQSEADELVQLIKSTPKPSLRTTDYLRGVVLLGFHVRNEDWYTVKGTPLRSSGFCKWGKGQPDGGTNETCGAMFTYGRLNDVHCEDDKAFFICEHDIATLGNSINNRFGGEKPDCVMP